MTGCSIGTSLRDKLQAPSAAVPATPLAPAATPAPAGSANSNSGKPVTDSVTESAQDQAASLPSDQPEPAQEPAAPAPGQSDSAAEPQAPASEQPDPAAEPRKPTVSHVTLGAIGDVLIHRPVYLDAKQKDGTYSFLKMFEAVKTAMQRPDILVANQESMIGGQAIGLSTYPRFNSPYEVGDALKAAGVDFVTMANNHTLDRGEQAIQSAIKHWDKIGMPYTGAYKNEEDQHTIRTVTRNNITLSLLAYTYGTNGIPVPKGKAYLVNLIDLKRIQADVERAKQMSDVVVVSMHWGIEYQDFPNDTQTALAKQLSDMGVDIIIGNHPHVLQPPAWVSGKAGHKTFVFYSLGNFISSQEGIKKQIGGIGLVDITKTTTGGQSTITINSPSFMPTYVDFRDWRGYKVLPLEAVNDTQLKNAKQQFNRTINHMRSNMTDLSIFSN